MNPRLLLPLLLIPLLSACGLPTRTYHIHITNGTSDQLSVGLIKNGPPVEEGWQAPADIAIGAPALADRHWGHLVEPQGMLVIGPQKGHFSDDVHAVLHVYVGNPTVEELLAYRRDDPDRVDVFVFPGPSSYIIQRRAGRLVAIRREAPPAEPAPSPVEP